MKKHTVSEESDVQREGQLGSINTPFRQERGQTREGTAAKRTGTREQKSRRKEAEQMIFISAANTCRSNLASKLRVNAQNR